MLVHRGRRLEREGCSDRVRSAQNGNGCGREAGTDLGLESKLHDTINLEDWVHGQKLGLKVRWVHTGFSYLPWHRRRSADSYSCRLSCYPGCHSLSAMTQRSPADWQSPPVERKADKSKQKSYCSLFHLLSSNKTWVVSLEWKI